MPSKESRVIFLRDTKVTEQKAKQMLPPSIYAYT